MTPDWPKTSGYPERHARNGLVAYNYGTPPQCGVGFTDLRKDVVSAKLFWYFIPSGKSVTKLGMSEKLVIAPPLLASRSLPRPPSLGPAARPAPQAGTRGGGPAALTLLPNPNPDPQPYTLTLTLTLTSGRYEAAVRQAREALRLKLESFGDQSEQARGCSGCGVYAVCIDQSEASRRV